MKFLRNLLRRFRRKAVLFPRAYDRNRAAGIRSLREFDDRITALYSGFTGADDYYYRAAAARVLDRIAVPTLILHALDDPFIRLTAETRDKIAANPNITLIETEHGGHCAFLAQPDAGAGYDGYWAEHTLLRFLLATPEVAFSSAPSPVTLRWLVMLSEWSVECSADDPVLVVPWSDPSDRTGNRRFIDLRENPYDLDHLPEAEQLPSADARSAGAERCAVAGLHGEVRCVAARC